MTVEMRKLKTYTDYLIQILDCVDFNDMDWPMVGIVDEEYDNLGQYAVNEDLADLLRDIKETMVDEGDYD